MVAFMCFVGSCVMPFGIVVVGGECLGCGVRFMLEVGVDRLLLCLGFESWGLLGLLCLRFVGFSLVWFFILSL